MTDHDRGHPPAARTLRTAGEVVLLALATLSAWPFGGADYFWEYVLAAVVTLLAGLWAAHAVVTRRFRFTPDLVSVCLAGLVLLSLVQLIPLPLGVVRVIAPGRAELHDALVPAQLEQLPGEPEPAGFRFVPLSVDRYATRGFAGRVLAVFVVYAAARNWLANRAALRRLAWAGLANGVALAAFALGQFFSSKGTVMFGAVDVGVRPFGPFVCRNHYPDFAALCLGLAAGLILSPTAKDPEKKKEPKPGDVPPEGFWDRVVELVTAPVQLLEKPAALAAALAAGLMLVSIPFSLSRSGLLALIGAVVGTWVLGRWRSKGGDGAVGWALTVAVGVAAAVFLWLGADPLQKRFDETLTARSADDRTAIWTAAARQLPGYWLTGTGGGSFLRVEPLGRGGGAVAADAVTEHAHNEYVEAAVEGGVVRLGLTLVLVVGVLMTAARGYRKLREKAAGGLLLGAWFGLLMLALHAATDFAIHVPAVALLAAVVSGYAVAVGSDDERATVRRKVRRRRKAAEDPTPQPPPRSGEGESGTPSGSEGVASGTSRMSSPPDPSARPPASGFALAVAVLLPVLCLLITLDARSRSRADDIRIAAERVRLSDAADRFDKRVAYQERRAAVAPGDPWAWFDLAQAHLDAAVEARGPADQFPPAVVERHVVPALRALRTARELCPAYPAVHARLGLYAAYFTRSDPPRVYLERAKRLLPNDPQVWYACGRESLRAGDAAAAEADWRRALELAPTDDRLLKAILTAAAGLPPAAVRNRVLPDDPWMLTAAADALFPDRVKRSAERRPFLERAVAAADGVYQPTLPQLRAAAAACGELGRPDRAAALWKAAAKEPWNENDTSFHLYAAAWFEEQELYAAAVEHLEWLVNHSGVNKALEDRLQAARHGAKLADALKR